jgi:hypothetical protein
MSKTKGIIIIRKITIMKRAGRLLSKIELITVVALTAVALAVVVGSGLAAAEILEIFCKTSVALVNAAVAFSKALVVFSNLSLTVSDIASPPVALVVLIVLANPPPVVVFLRGSVAFSPDGEEVGSY